METLNIHNNIIYQAGLLWQPRVLKPLVDWLPEFRFISPAESDRTGMWDHNIAPVAKCVFNAFNDPKVERITVMSSAQFVKTEILKSILAYIVYYDLGSVLCIFSTDKKAKKFTNKKFDPMVKANPWMLKKIAPYKSNSKDNTMNYKKFGPFFIAIVGGNVPDDLAMESVKFVFTDDRDRVGIAGKEGSAPELGWERTESFTGLGRKRMDFSTPTIAGWSPIEADYENSNMSKWYVPCPYCNHYQVLKFDNLVWEKTEKRDLFGNITGKIHHPETVKLKCINKDCNALIEERFKSWMQINGKALADHPEIEDHFGLGELERANSLMSSWVDIVKSFLDRKNDPSKLQVFFNTVLGRTWKISDTERIKEEGLLARVENYVSDENPYLPNGILYLTAGTDTQGDRLETFVLGIGKEEELWLVHYERLIGDPDFGEVFNLHDQLLEKKWKREDGVELQIGGYKYGGRYYSSFIDAMGKKTNTKSVYEYTLRRQHRGIFSIRGRANDIRTNYPPIINASKVGPYRQTILYNLGVDTIKQIMFKRLQNNPVDETGKFKGGPRTIHFPARFCDYEFFKQLLSEMPQTTKNLRGEQVVNWVKTNERNEPWDTLQYAYAAFLNSYVNLEEIEKQLLKQKDNPEKEDTREEKQVGSVRLKPYRGGLGGFSVNSWK